jgi:hypothetical protein
VTARLLRDAATAHPGTRRTADGRQPPNRAADGLDACPLSLAPCLAGCPNGSPPPYPLPKRTIGAPGSTCCGRSRSGEGEVIELILVPVKRRPGHYDAMLGPRRLCRSHQPFLDAARVLLAEGVAPEAVLDARHQGSAIVAMCSTVGEAAKWTIVERDGQGLRREPWHPRPRMPRQDGAGTSAGASDFARGGAEGTAEGLAT